MPVRLLNQFLRTNSSFRTVQIHLHLFRPVGPRLINLKLQLRSNKGKLEGKQRDRETYLASSRFQTRIIPKTDSCPTSALLRIDDLSPGQPPHKRTVSKAGDRTLGFKPLRRFSLSGTRQTLSESYKRLFSTQPRVGNMEDLTSRTDRASITEPPTTTEASKPQTANDTTSAPSTQNQSQSQPQQKKEKKPKAPKQPSTPTNLPLSPALIDLRVGHILRCIPHENADSLYVSTIAMGVSKKNFTFFCFFAFRALPMRFDILRMTSFDSSWQSEYSYILKLIKVHSLPGGTLNTILYWKIFVVSFAKTAYFNPFKLIGSTKPLKVMIPALWHKGCRPLLLCTYICNSPSNWSLLPNNS